jgi:hypothetical protein
MLDNLALFIGRGSLCLLVYSAVFSRGVDRVKRELVEGDSEGSLVVGPFWLCTSEVNRNKRKKKKIVVFVE